MDAVTIAVTPGLTLKVDDKEYIIEFPLPAVIAAEEKLGRPLRNPADWFGASAKDIPVLLEAGLKRHHPGITPDTIASICDPLGPEACSEVAEALGTLAFPRFTAAYKKNLAELRAKGEAPPKESSGDGL